jgi:hypothetical protein
LDCPIFEQERKMSSNTWKKIYFDLQRTKYEKCLHPSGSCTIPPIRAHSIQNSKILEVLCKDGHVVMPQIEHDSKGKPSIEFKLVGRNQSSIFTGLCSKHDTEIFKPIELDSVLDMRNEEHLFLLAYRSVLKETHTSIESACRLQSGYNQRVQSGLSPSDRPDEAGMQATTKIMNAYDMDCFKKKLDNAFLLKDFGRLHHIDILFENTSPSVAVSSLFSLDDTGWSDDVVRTALNVFPLDQGTVALFSFLAEDEQCVTQYFQKLIAASGHYQKYLISKVILQHTENFVLSPTFYNYIDEVQKKAIRDFLCMTLFENMHEYEDPSLYLFWDT